ncbi:MAG: ATPase [Verrucomicrobia bacterium]|nr:ATPase [Verrucomicrobiota bacterium]
MKTTQFIGRRRELEDFSQLLRKKSASLVTCQGRRRVGKSRFIAECARKADHFLSFSGLPPREGGSSREAQLDSFAERLAEQTRLPKVPLASWPVAFQLLASQLPAAGTVVVLLDEISWLGAGDQDFAGHLKNAWDTHFSRRSRLILVLCGSVSAWIERNILGGTGFVGRCSWQFRLEPLSLGECALFWGRRHERTSVADKLRVLAVTGGIPKYLEEIDPGQSAESNVERLCFNPGGLLFHEFDQIFHDLFARRAATSARIVRAMIHGPKTVDEISRLLDRERGGSLSDSLEELEQAGFIRRDVSCDPATGNPSRRDFRFRLSDNYLRFYLKYVEPEAHRIKSGLYQRTPLGSLVAWDTIAGLQFENLVLGSMAAVLECCGLARVPVLSAGPYTQTKTRRREGCQIDLLIRAKHAVHVIETKFRRTIPKAVIAEVREKAARLKLPAGLSVRTGLIYAGELDPAIARGGFFDHLIPAEELFKS